MDDDGSGAVNTTCSSAAGPGWVHDAVESFGEVHGFLADAILALDDEGDQGVDFEGGPFVAKTRGGGG